MATIAPVKSNPEVKARLAELMIAPELPHPGMLTD
jgi:hypothetical protein